MSSCVITADPDGIILIPILFIWLLFFPYLTLTTQFFSHLLLNLYMTKLCPQKQFYTRSSVFFSKIMHKLFSCSKVKVGLLLSKKNCFICFHENPLKMMENAFYFILKAFFVVKIFTFLFSDFNQIDKTAWLER